MGEHVMSYDVIGAGPAGSTVSTLLAQSGRHILLLEKSRFPREKLCGEFITPECLNVFARFLVGGFLRDAPPASNTIYVCAWLTYMF